MSICDIAERFDLNARTALRYLQKLEAMLKRKDFLAVRNLDRKVFDADRLDGHRPDIGRHR